jgi:hypothetical protein
LIIKNANTEKLAMKSITYKKKENLSMLFSKNATYKIDRESAEFIQNRKNT